MRNNFADKDCRPRFERDFTGAQATACVITVAADPAQFPVLDWVIWSYDAAPTGGRLTVAIGGVNYLDVAITAGGPGMIRCDPPLYNPAETKSEAMVITLASGSGTVVGKLQARVR